MSTKGLTAQDVHRWRSEWDRLKGDPIGWFEYIAAQVNARLAQNEDKCPNCGGIASLPNRDRFDVFCDGPFHAAPAQDLARLEALEKWMRDMADYWAFSDREPILGRKNTYRICAGKVAEELTLLRAQQAKETK